MKAFSGILIFLAGAATGILASWKMISNELEERYKADVASVKDAYKKLQDLKYPTDELEKPDKKAVKAVRDHMRENLKKGRNEYSSIAKKYSTETEKIDYSSVKPLNYELEDMIEEDIAMDDIEESKPYVIQPTEFGNSDIHDIQELRYYEPDAENPRGVLTDGWEPLTEEEIEAAVGSDYYTHFGEYEDSRVIIRNDERRMEYEIVKEYETYNEHLANE